MQRRPRDPDEFHRAVRTRRPVEYAPTECGVTGRVGMATAAGSPRGSMLGPQPGFRLLELKLLLLG